MKNSTEFAGDLTLCLHFAGSVLSYRVRHTQDRRLTVDTDTSFSCDGPDRTEGGYYADVEAECQPFHVCSVDSNTGGLVKYSFLCLNVLGRHGIRQGFEVGFVPPTSLAVAVAIPIGGLAAGIRQGNAHHGPDLSTPTPTLAYLRTRNRVGCDGLPHPAVTCVRS